MIEVQAVDFTVAVGQRVKFSYVPNHETTPVELEGTVDMVNAGAMIVKPKGSTMVKLIETRTIVEGSFEILPEVPRELKAKLHTGVGISNVRHHLLDRHGSSLAEVNKMVDAEALAAHNRLDHGSLGHFHTARDEATKEN